MRLSVVVPALNEERNVARAVASAREGAGAADHCEVVVVDGGSDDATVSVAHSAGADAVLVSPERGRAAQLARGVERCSGDVIVFLHADSTLPDGYAERLRDAMKPEHSWGAFGFRLAPEERDDDDDDDAADPSTAARGSKGPGRRFLEWCVDKRTRWMGAPYGDQGVWVKRHALDSVGGVPQQCFMEDYELVKRLRRRHGMPCVVDAAVTTSSRRWDAMGVARVTALNQLIVFGYAMGVAPERLARWYTAGRNMGGETKRWDTRAEANAEATKVEER